MRSPRIAVLQTHVLVLVLSASILGGCDCLRGSGLTIGRDDGAETTCDSVGASCGQFVVEGTAFDCGSCNTGERCSSAHRCVSELQTDADYCRFYWYECGEATVIEDDGTSRVIDCGDCLDPLVCGADAAHPHRCACVPETDRELCEANAVPCGELYATDRCNRRRTVSCDFCVAPFFCNAAGYVCACIPEADSDLCEMLAKECGRWTVTDRCGTHRLVDCGAECPSGGTCDANGHCQYSPNCHVAWCVEHTPFLGTLNAIWASGTNDIWAVGEAGALLNHGASGWALVTGPSSAESLLAVTETASSVWVAGEQGALWTAVRTGTGTWTTVSLPGTTRWRIVGLFAASDSEVWVSAVDAAAGTHALMQRFGSVWKVFEETTTTSTGAPASSLWRDETGTFWAVVDGAVVTWTSAEWSAAVPTPGVRIASWAHDVGGATGVLWAQGERSDDVWGWDGQSLLHWDGATWTSIGVRSGVSLAAGCGVVRGGFWAVGGDAWSATGKGAAAHVAASSGPATVDVGLAAEPLRGCTSAAGTVWAVGEHGALLEYVP